MNSIEPQIAANLAKVRDRMAAACARAGRGPASVQLVAVTKYAAWEWVEALVQLGQRCLGESRPQQLIERAERLNEPAQVEWHLVGHLQRNKVRSVLPHVERIHSVDTFRLLERIELLAHDLNLEPQVMLEVNVSHEGSKDGFNADELEQNLELLLGLSQVRITGLMTMAPFARDEQTVRTVFRNLRSLRDRLQERSAGRLDLPELSMGMSGDFELAIEEGSTHVRIGSRLFEGL